MSFLIGLKDDVALDAALVGHKFASLARSQRAGLPVPSAIVVSVEAHLQFISNGQWPSGLQDEVLQAAIELGISGGLSVRSSATVEDLAGGSFAGQYRTFLNVRDEVALIEKIESCWASSELVSESYYARFSDREGTVKQQNLMAVILQRMVHARAAGVAFSKNPMQPSRREVVIEATEGLGEELVSGRISPYRAFVRAERKVLVECSSALAQRKCPLQTYHWRRVASLARRAEQLASEVPQDIEWALDQNDTVWLLQSRPITAVRELDVHAPEGVWTRKIADDLWADRLTPFLADAMLTNAPRYDLSRYARLMGVQSRSSSLAVINGYLYVNCQALKPVLELIPKHFRTGDLLALFPPGFEADAPSPSMLKIASLLLRCAVLPFLEPKANPLICQPIALHRIAKLRDGLRKIKAGRLNGTPEQKLEDVRDAVEFMACLQELNQWPYSYATLFTWLLRWMVVDLGGLQHGDFLQLLSEGSSNVTVEIEAEIARIAGIIRRDEQMKRFFSEVPPDELCDALPPVIQNELTCFLRRFGVRSRNRTLYVKRWSEDPEQVVGMLALLVKEPAGKSKATSRKLKSVVDRLPWPVRLLLRLVCQQAANYLDLREELRFLLDEILYLIRSSLLDLGDGLGLGNKTMFLTSAELSDLVTGRMSIEDAESLSGSRLKVFNEVSEPYSYYIEGRPINELFSRAGIIRGVGTSSGKASGYARIVEDPSRSDLKQGDILVAKSTDPGWTPVLSIVGGIVAEEGGLLNHCSIVARELGIPAVVGVREATRRIREGSFITIDGDLGVVQTE